MINPSTVRISWHAPPESEQNGPITSFIIDFNNSIIPTPYNQTEEITLTYPISIIIGFVSNFTVEEGITYSVSVRAVNGAGIGLTSESITITTPVAGEWYNILIIHSVNTTNNFSFSTTSRNSFLTIRSNQCQSYSYKHFFLSTNINNSILEWSSNRL